MSRPSRSGHGKSTLAAFKPRPNARPPVRVNPNVGRAGGRPATFGSTSNNQTGKLDSVPPSTMTDLPVSGWSRATGSKK
jgi:hypothetical protein